MKNAAWGLLTLLAGAGILVAYALLAPVPTEPATVDLYIAGWFVALIAAVYVTLTPYPWRKGS